MKAIIQFCPNCSQKLITTPRSAKGHYPVQHKDTTYTHKEVIHIDPILNKKL